MKDKQKVTSKRDKGLENRKDATSRYIIGRRPSWHGLWPGRSRGPEVDLVT